MISKPRKNSLFRQLLTIIAGLYLAGSASAAESHFQISLTTNEAPAGFVEVRGVETGPFDPGLWKSGKLNLVPDRRFPLLAPLPGNFRNIYAPSAVQTPEGYRLFYGAWDGIPSGNDHIYSVTTDANFQSFENRHQVITPGNFVHVCNVNAFRLDDSSYAMFTTVYPVAGQNRPGFFKSDVTGTNWNGDFGEPHTVQMGDIVDISGYNYTNSDINGMNVMLRENGHYHLYFGDVHNQPGTFRASSDDGKHYRFEAKVFSGSLAVNDVKKFRVGNESFYLMALHVNQPQIWQTVSTNGLEFPPAQVLLTNAALADHYIVAVGWVTRGAEELPDRKLIGVLYGAGPVSTFDHNQIFARWLQKKIVFVAADGTRFAGIQSLGPDRQLLQISEGLSKGGHFEIYAEDGLKLLATIPAREVTAGQTYELLQP